MRVSSIGILAIAALGVSVSAVNAQVEAISFPIDEPVRVWRHSVPEVPLTGRVSSWTYDSLNLVQPPGPPTPIPLSDLARMEINRTRGHAGTGALVGGGIGAALGLAMGIAVANDDFLEAGADDVLLATAFLAASGAGFGALIGLVIRTEDWEEVPLAPRTSSRQE